MDTDDTFQGLGARLDNERSNVALRQRLYNNICCGYAM